ncbi:MAG: hypothetical protein Q9184_007392 [Pyrenodesmia sp. 2 TL-2023]
MILTPQNYLLNDPSHSNVYQTRINILGGNVTDALTFGVKQLICAIGMAVAARNPRSWVRMIWVEKFPYVPDAQLVGNPGEGRWGGEYSVGDQDKRAGQAGRLW